MIRPLLMHDALLADIAAAHGDGRRFHLWWLGQSGFLVQWAGRHLLFDPYLSESLTQKYAGTDKPHVRMTERIVRPERLDFIDVVTSSHNHTDHLDGETLVPLLAANPGIGVVVPDANCGFAAERMGVPVERLIGLDDGKSVEVAGFELTGLPAAHDELERDEKGRHKNLGYVVRFGGPTGIATHSAGINPAARARFGSFSVYHSGDTRLYDGMVERLRPFAVDVALLPINGHAAERRVAGNLSGAEAAWLAHAIGAKVLIPCHYDMFEFNTASPDECVAECRRLGQEVAVLRCGERWSFPV
jgi:L-ascorbate metabolism protein UlaG (beta-lactamase superfamily)